MGTLQEKAFGVWLCKNYQWECFVMDDYVKVNELSKPLYTYHTGTVSSIQVTKNGQMSYNEQLQEHWVDMNSYLKLQPANFLPC